MVLFSGKHDYVIGENGISAIEKVWIGEMEQTILIQTEEKSNPILLLLHGGPSLPLPGVSSRGRDYTITTNTKELVKNFVLVFWDQRGTGQSYNKRIMKDTMNVSQFVSDTIELTDYLRSRFNKEKIFLAGHSWGSILGLTAISQQPCKYYSYIGISQIVNWTENDRLGLDWAKEEAKRRGNIKALNELNSVGEPPFLNSFEQWGVLRKWQRKFNTLIYSDEDIKHPGLFKITMDMFKSKEYSLKDIINTFYRGFKLIYTFDFINELPRINFKETTQKIDIPITFKHGAKDVHVHVKPIEDYYKLLKCDKGKQLIWMEKSAHAFHPDDTKLIEQHLINELKHIVQST